MEQGVMEQGVSSRQEALEPETLAVLAASYDRAIEILTHTGELRDRSPAVSELLAKKIIELSQEGKRDPTRLTIDALKFVRASGVFEKRTLSAVPPAR
ncbi:MAG: hypothetical protein RO009_01650 [Pseudorhodoplanes sp.]|jgi:hypothetical protein|nr:hypothetical protein [Pseudorhodoplanes sp.]